MWSARLGLGDDGSLAIVLDGGKCAGCSFGAHQQIGAQGIRHGRGAPAARSGRPQRAIEAYLDAERLGASLKRRDQAAQAGHMSESVDTVVGGGDARTTEAVLLRDFYMANRRGRHRAPDVQALQYQAAAVRERDRARVARGRAAIARLDNQRFVAAALERDRANEPDRTGAGYKDARRGHRISLASRPRCRRMSWGRRRSRVRSRRR